jgi:hypothetical protein
MHGACCSYTFDSLVDIALGKNFVPVGGDVCNVGELMSAFNVCTLRVRNRFYDVFWRIRRLLNVGPERDMANALKDINKFLDAAITYCMNNPSADRCNLNPCSKYDEASRTQSELDLFQESGI